MSKQQRKEVDKAALSDLTASKTAGRGGAWWLDDVQAVAAGGGCRQGCTLGLSK